jgi:hypothetical protein
LLQVVKIVWDLLQTSSYIHFACLLLKKVKLFAFSHVSIFAMNPFTHTHTQIEIETQTHHSVARNLEQTQTKIDFSFCFV